MSLSTRALTGIALACWMAGANAVDFPVNSTVDAQDASPGNGICADANGNCTLRAAILETEAAAGPDKVLLPAGTYNLTLGALGFSGQLTIEGSGAAVTVIDAGGISRVMGMFGGATTLRDLTIRNGNSTTAGGIYVNASGAVLTLDHAAVTGNTAVTPGGQGGGVYVSSGAIANVIDSTIANNTSVNGGAGLRVVTGGTATVERSTISGNTTTGDGAGGGGIESQGTLVVTNSTLSGNTVPSGSGGAIAVESGTASIVYSTIVDNGGAQQLQCNGATCVGLRGTLIALPRGNTVNCSGTITSLGDNLDSGTSCGFGAGNISNAGDPKLGPLADNGGPTRAHRLLPGSPARDGSSEACPPPDTDQRGVERPLDSLCDIGAFESDTLLEDGFEG